MSETPRTCEDCNNLREAECLANGCLIQQFAPDSSPPPAPSPRTTPATTYPPDCLGCGCRFIDHGEPGSACPEFGGGFSAVHVYRDSALPAAAPTTPATAEPMRAGFHAGHAIALHLVIELAAQQEPLGDERADANVRNSIARAREVQAWLEPLVHVSVAPSAPPAPAPGETVQAQDQLRSGETMKSASPNQPQGLVPSRDAGRALDAIIAEKVMGATWRDSDGAARAACSIRRMRGTPKHTLALSGRVLCWRSVSGAMLIPDDGPGDNLPHYSTDMAAALLIVEKLSGENTVILRWCFDGFVAEVFPHENALAMVQVGVDPRDGGMPLAICRAALAAVEATDAH